MKKYIVVTVKTADGHAAAMFGRSPQQLLVAAVLLALQQRMTGAADGGPGAADGGPGATDGGPGATDGGPRAANGGQGAEEEKEERLWRDLDHVKLELGEMEKVTANPPHFFILIFLFHLPYFTCRILYLHLIQVKCIFMYFM